MDKDKELLLSLGKDSDSDDVVEEFKLPPPRSKRSKRYIFYKAFDTLHNLVFHY